MAYKKLRSAAQHQIEGLSSRCTEAFTCDSYHYVGVLGYKLHDSLEAGNYAGGKFYEDADCSTLVAHRFLFELFLNVKRVTVKN